MKRINLSYMKRIYFLEHLQISFYAAPPKTKEHMF